ncbi:hypothetical protein DDQ41_29065 [Streptomyces spongiicola]|uniref:Transcription elongation factor GreA/GreB C-terminal domain-containing protein n=1 Tax=Streptomyces spongiicola TaxID=1690221 RepID=A0ABM6VDV2_9ACTN|nr:hypothetical protein [Streptomyces spongiicola]AWK12297.1 hypothetical protein DDQ41_29065 [Streptomyces spongiicola]
MALNSSTAAARQRDLERVDWTFVRIRGSRFHYDREQALAPLWAELERLGIEPVSEEPEAPAAPAEPAAPRLSPAGGRTEDDESGGRTEDDESGGRTEDDESGGRTEDDECDRTRKRDEAGEPREAGEAGEPQEGKHPERPGPRPHPGSARAEPSGPGPDDPRMSSPAPAEGAAQAPAPRPAQPGRRSSPPVPEIPPAAFRRLVREMRELRAAVDAPDGTPEGLDAAKIAYLRRTQADQRERRTKRLGFLRGFLDAVRVGEEAGRPEAVYPGALLVLEFDGRLDEANLYTIAELPTEEAETVSPSSPLGQALMWQPTGREITYEASQGRTHAVVVREIRI